MAHFEEKILAYLDGSLSEADREEVLAKISSTHGSERALFDAHLRLQDLYSVARKPVSAPLALQRELASQVPVLALKLPYLAAPGQRRNRFATGWLRSVRSSWVNVFLLLAAALLVGGVWYAVSNNSHSQNASTVTNSIDGGSLAGGTSNAVSAATSQNTALTNANRVQTSLHGTDGSYATNNSSSGHADNIVSMRSAGVRNVSANRNTNHTVNANGTSTTEGTQNNGSTTTMQANAPAAVNSPASEQPAMPGNTANLPPLALHSVDAAAVQPASFQAERAMPVNPIVDENSSSFNPWHVYAVGGSRYMIPMSKLSQYVTESNTGKIGNWMTASSEAGAEYEFTPWTSAGVRAGWTSFAQYQPLPHNTTSPLFIQYSDFEVAAVPAVWCALAVTETLNPQDQTRYALSLAGGPAFTAPVAWMGMIEASISYDLSPTLMLRGGVSYDIEQVKQSAGGANITPSSTTGIIIASPGGALTSNAIGLNLGISFHP
jgi:hypothetical protein